MKRLLSLLLAVALVLGSAGAAVAATPSTVAGPKFSDIAGNRAEGDITLLAALSIMRGDAGATTARPASTITRAEFAAMIVRMLGKDPVAATLNATKPTTVDAIPGWAWGYVNLTQSLGIMSGYPDGTFLPNNPVTFAEALAMLERAVGYEPKAVGAWPTNYMLVAGEYGFMEGVNAIAGLKATRGDVAMMMVNTMFIDKFLSTDSAGVDHFGDALLDSVTVAGSVTAVDPAGNTISIGGSKALAATVCLVGADAFSELLNISVKAIAVDGKIAYVEVAEATGATTVSGVYANIIFPTATDSATYIKLKSGGQYPIRDVSITGQLNTVALANFVAFEFNVMVGDPLVLNLAEGRVVYVIISRANLDDLLVKSVTKIDAVNYHLVLADILGAGAHETAPLDITTATPLTIDGAKKTVADLKTGDVVYGSTVGSSFAADADIMDITAYRATVKGVVSAIKTAASGVTITLELADGDTRQLLLNQVATPGIGDTVEYRLDADGEARFNVAFAPTACVGYITDVSTVLAGGSTTYHAELDIEGVKRDCLVGGPDVLPHNGLPDAYEFIEDIGAGCFIQFMTDVSGKIDTVVQRSPHLVINATVVTVDAASGIVVVNDAGVYRTFGADGVVVYQENADGSYTYIGLDGLAKDDTVSFDNNDDFILLIRSQQ